MRHHNKVKSFNRPRNQRQALMRSLAYSLVKHESIVTTTAKAKALRPVVEKLVTRAKDVVANNSLSSRRLLIAQSGSEEVAKKLEKEIAPRYQNRLGGYIRITKLPPRESDGAEMAVIEFV